MPKISHQLKESKISLIIEHALNLFSEKGYNNTTIDDIAQSTGISKGGIYVHFKSKEDIFCAIAKEVTINRHALISNPPMDQDYQTQLKFYLETILGSYLQKENFRRIRFSFEFWISKQIDNSIKKTELKEFNNNRFVLMLQDIKTMIKGGIVSKEFKPDLDLESISYIILAAIDGMAFYTGIMDQNLTEKQVHCFSKLVLDAIKN
ncbi:MAG: TetR/AcrR family transcriptional regulator [Spirochaetes bacterium]|nr:TetR/AcrR family transcriptional regulator [Spirochaetota bacterium]